MKIYERLPEDQKREEHTDISKTPYTEYEKAFHRLSIRFHVDRNPVVKAHALIKQHKILEKA